MDVCYGLSCVLPKAQVLALVPNVTAFGDRDPREVIKVK